MDNLLIKTFGGKVRVRCMAVVMKQGRILLIEHGGLNRQNSYWMPPGGGLEPKESVVACLYRELKEEAGLKAVGCHFLTSHEFISEHLHAFELFFSVTVEDALANVGLDPEFGAENQVLKGLRWMSSSEVTSLNPQTVHPIVKQLFDYKV